MSLRWFSIDDDGGSNEACFLCFADDPFPFTADWALLVAPAVIPQVNQYGFLGFPQTRQNAGTQPTANWDTCPTTDFCDGPEFEGVGQPDRFVRRWRTKMEPNILGTWDVSYSKVGDPWAPAPALLFPAPLPAATEWLTISFDPVSLACWAWDDGAGGIELRRFVAGVPTTYNFLGHSPRLLYDGILQRDNALVDLVCFYMRLGDLYARFERDNFGVEYLIANVAGGGLGTGIDHLTKTDRVHYLGGDFQYLYFVTTDLPIGKNLLLQSAAYPPWPVRVADPGLQGLQPAASAYVAQVVPFGPVGDTGGKTQTLTPGGGDYPLLVVLAPLQSDPGTQAMAPAASNYPQLVVLAGTFPEPVTHALTPAAGNYPLIVVFGGNYADASTHSLGPGGGAYT